MSTKLTFAEHGTPIPEMEPERVIDIEDAAVMHGFTVDNVTVAMFNEAYDRWQARRMREGTLTVPPMTCWRDAMWRSSNAARIMKENEE